MPWDVFFILTSQIIIWFIVLALPLYLLAGSIAQAVGRGFRTGFFGRAISVNQSEGKKVL